MKEVSLDEVLKVINLSLEGPQITQEHIKNNLVDLGMDSLTFIQMVVALEETFDCEIPDSKLLATEMDTVEKIVEVLQNLYENSKNLN